MAGKMKQERSEYLASFDGLEPSILKSIAQLHPNVPWAGTACGTCAPTPSLSPAVRR